MCQIKGVLALHPIFKKICCSSGNTKEQDNYVRLFYQADFLCTNKPYSRDS